MKQKKVSLQIKNLNKHKIILNNEFILISQNMGQNKKKRKFFFFLFQQLSNFSEVDLVGSYCKFEEKSVLIIFGNFLA